MLRIMVLIFCFIFGNLGVSPIYAERPSFSGSDTLEDVIVEIDGVQESFTILRDAQRKGQYYYIPNTPRLYEQIINGEKRPEFLLVRYQAPEPDNPENFKEAGLIQFSVRLSIPPVAIEQLKAALAGRVEAEGPITLSALRLKSATVNLYDDDGSLVSRKQKADSIAPTFASQKMAFQIPVTKLGADVYDALVNGNTGVLVNFTLEYEGLTAPVGVSCEVDWEKTHSLYSRDQSFAASASYLGLITAGANVDRQKIRQKLEEEKAVNCKSISDENFDADQMAAKLIAYINSNVIKDFKAPDKIEIPKAERQKFNKQNNLKKLFGFGGQASYATSIKDLKDIRSLRTTYNMDSQSVEIRKTSVSGFIGVGRYSEDIRENAVVEVPSGQWPKAFFGLPTVSGETGLQRVDYQVQLNTSPPQSQVATWRSDGSGWRDLQGKPRNSLAFGLLGINNAEAGDLQFTET